MTKNNSCDECNKIQEDINCFCNSCINNKFIEKQELIKIIGTANVNVRSNLIMDYIYELKKELKLK